MKKENRKEIESSDGDFKRVTNFIEEGDYFLGCKKYKEALGQYNNALAISPDGLAVCRALSGKARALSNSGKSGEAIKLIDYYLTKTPTETHLRYVKGGILQSIDRHEDAIAVFEELLRMGEQRHGAGGPLYAICVSLSALGKYEDVVELYQDVIQREPNDKHALFNLGNALFALSRYNEAIRSFKKASSLDSSALGPVYGRARALLSLRRHKDVVAICEDVLINFPDDAYFLKLKTSAEREHTS